MTLDLTDEEKLALTGGGKRPSQDVPEPGVSMLLPEGVISADPDGLGLECIAAPHLARTSRR
jgi:hypothetical protein